MIQDLNKKIGDISAEKDSMKSAFSKSDALLKRKIDDLTVENGRLKELESQYNRLKTENEKISILTQACQKYQEQIIEMEKVNNDLKEKVNVVGALQQQNASLSRENDILKTENEKINILTQACQKYQEQIIEMEKVNIDLKEKVNVVGALQQQNASLSRENDNLKTENEKINIVTQACQKYQEQIMEMEKVNNDLTEKVNVVGALQQQNASLSRENDNLKTENEKINIVTQACQKYQEQIMEMEKVNNDLTEKVNVVGALQQQNASLSRENENLANTIRNLNDELSKLDCANKSLSEIKNQYERLKKENEEIPHLKSSNQQLAEDLKNLNVKNNEKVETIAKLQKKNEKLIEETQHQKEHMDMEMQKVQRELVRLSNVEKECAVLKTENMVIEQLQKSNAEFKTQLSEIGKLQVQLSENKNLVTNLEIDKGIMAKEKQNLVDNLTKSREECSQLNIEIQKLKVKDNQYNEIIKENENLKHSLEEKKRISTSEVEKVRVMLCEKEKAIEKLEKEIEKLAKENSSVKDLANKRKSSEEECKKVKLELKKSKELHDQEIDRLNGEINDVILEVQEFKSESGNQYYHYFFKANVKPLTTNVPHHIETSQLICSANQLTGFFMMRNIFFIRVFFHGH